MTTPHPTPEERYEVAWALAKGEELRYTEAWLRDKSIGASPDRINFLQAAMIAAIREAEAAGEARGRAMERKEITARARRLRKRFGKCEGSFREEIIWGHGLRIEKMIRARTDKENSDD